MLDTETKRKIDNCRDILLGKILAGKTKNQRQIAATDSQIDKLVYELYGLTEDEIKIVEGS